MNERSHQVLLVGLLIVLIISVELSHTSIYDEAFWLNLGTEVLGIIITVFVIDDLLKQREEKRWLPSRHHLYMKLIYLFDNTIRQFAPGISGKFSPAYYSFGPFPVVTAFELDMGAVTFVLNNLDVENQLEKYRDILNQLKHDLDDITNQSLFLLEPETTWYILTLEQALKNIQLSFPNNPTYLSLMGYTNLLRRVLIQTIAARIVIESRATKKITKKEFDKYSNEQKITSDKFLNSLYQYKW